ncbi:hypothetical protein NADFUDRAFT_44914 [Nadsonia fulvescens var. elongata DSM 6958]|uniref:Uncharacterized protein n=1 Tax=Nadsonia fulvescens var. elongata DSM 6958 TaxID=857566 RepID=A0A1E3PSA5_9ASCO|nr:hypothetical protein NADFUDRAFT_44914 [Nadsonia fulvescens var. elongata DSM 6958]
MLRSITSSLSKITYTTTRFYSNKPNASQLTVMDFIARIQKNADKLGPINKKPIINAGGSRPPRHNKNNNTRRSQYGNNTANDFTDLMSGSIGGVAGAAPSRSGPSRFTRNQSRDGSTSQRSRPVAGVSRGSNGPNKTRFKSSRKMVRKETGSSAPFNLEAKISQMQAAAPSKISYEAPNVNTEELRNLTADLVYSVENCIRNARKILSELPESERDAQTIDRIVSEHVRGELKEMSSPSRKGVDSAVTTLNRNGSIGFEEKNYAMGIINGEFKPAPLK